MFLAFILSVDISFSRILIITFLFTYSAVQTAWSTDLAACWTDNLNAEKCPLFSNDGRENPYGELPPMWAQELIGGDLARDEVEKDPNAKEVRVGTPEEVNILLLEPDRLSKRLRDCLKPSPPPYCKRFFNFLDVYGDESYKKENMKSFYFGDPGHGLKVISLVVGPKPVRVAGKAKLSVSHGPLKDDNSDRPSESELVEEYQKFTDIVNMSKSRPLDQMKRIQKTNPIYVHAAGNDHPDPIRHSSLLRETGIVTGSISPIGLVSGFSNEGPVVDVLAPSDDLIQTRYGNLRLSFSGTSGAAPLVTGSLANVLSYLPGISLKELREMIAQTSIPLSSTGSGKNGKGMVNAYRLVMAAKRLSENWPQNKKKIYHPSTYDFKREAKELSKKGKIKFLNSDPCVRKEGFDLLRRAFLLDPTHFEYSKNLEIIYENFSFPLLAAFYRLQRRVTVADLFETYSKTSIPGVKAAILRETEDLGSKSKPFIEAALNSTDSYEVYAGVRTAIRTGQKNIIKDLLENTVLNPQLKGKYHRAQIIELAKDVIGERKTNILYRKFVLLPATKTQLDQTWSYVLGNKPSEKELRSLLEKAIQSPHLLVRYVAFLTIRRRDSNLKKFGDLNQRGLRDREESIRKLASETIKYAKENEK